MSNDRSSFGLDSLDIEEFKKKPKTVKKATSQDIDLVNKIAEEAGFTTRERKPSKKKVSPKQSIPFIVEGYIGDQIKNRAWEEKKSNKGLILTALKEYGLDIKDEDLVDKRKKKE